jgi:histidyl-tRNA synthetase
MFSGKQISAVGVGLGIERVFSIMEQQEKERNEV